LLEEGDEACIGQAVFYGIIFLRESVRGPIRQG
jgi:hypothetical protein